MKLYVALVVGFLVSLVASFLAGRFTAPERVTYLPGENNTRVVTVTRNREVVRRVVVVQTDAGTTTTTDEHEKELATPVPIPVAPAEPGYIPPDLQARNHWRVGALLGIGGIGAESGIHLIYGLEIERSLFGPFYGGLWGLSNGSVGASLKVEF